MSDSNNNKPYRPQPRLRNDAEAEAFVENSDLSEYDLSGFRPVQFEFAQKNAQVNMRLPAGLLSAIKDRAKQEGIPYQRFIRQTLESALRQHDNRR